jgi:hypothetical protein
MKKKERSEDLEGMFTETRLSFNFCQGFAIFGIKKDAWFR